MSPEDKKSLDLVGESFNRWYKREIESYVARRKRPVGMSDEAWATRVVAHVAQFTMGRLVTELESSGVALEQVISFLRKNVGS